MLPKYARVSMKLSTGSPQIDLIRISSRFRVSQIGAEEWRRNRAPLIMIITDNAMQWRELPATRLVIQLTRRAQSLNERLSRNI